MKMIYRNISGTEMNVSVLGYGGWGAGIRGWGNVSEKKVRESISVARECGINFFDTSPVYGYGKSEEILGEELAPYRKEIILASKCGLIQTQPGIIEHQLNPDCIRRELEGSLQRLKTDYIDLYQIHFPDEKTPLDTVFSFMQKIQQEGLIRYFGVSNFSLELLSENRNAGYVSVQNRFNTFQRADAESILPYCQKEKLSYFAYSPLCQGIFTNSIDRNFHPTRRDIRHLNPVFTDSAQFNAAFLQKDKMQTPLSEAFAFVLQTTGVTSAIATMTRPEHVRENILAAITAVGKKSGEDCI